MTKRKYSFDNSRALLVCKEDYIHDFDSVIITEFLLQLKRTKDTLNIEKTLHTLIDEYSKPHKDGKTPRNRSGLELLYRAIHYIRDPIRGLGEYHLAYTCIWVWYYYYPKLAKFAFHSFLFQSSIDSKQIGSWKDVKYFSNYIFQRTQNKHHPLIMYACKLMAEQIKKDNNEYTIYMRSLKDPSYKWNATYSSNFTTNTIIPSISLASKWCPRENKKYGWVFKQIVAIFYKIKATTPSSYRVKHYRKFRKILAKLNRYNDTIEIKQCSHNWANIQYSKISTGAWKRYIVAFMNKNESKQKDTQDRKEATVNFYNYMIRYYINHVENNTFHTPEALPSPSSFSSSSSSSASSSSSSSASSSSSSSSSSSQLPKPLPLSSSSSQLPKPLPLPTQTPTLNKPILRSTLEDKDLYDIVDVSVRFRFWGTLRPILPNYLFRKKCNMKTSLPYFIPFLNIHSVQNISYIEMISMISRVLYVSEKTSVSLRNRILISVQNRMKWLYIGKEMSFQDNKLEIKSCTIMEKVDIIWDCIIELQTKPTTLLPSVSSSSDSNTTGNEPIPQDYSTLQAIAFMLDSINETGLDNSIIEKLRLVYISDQPLEDGTHTSIQKMFKNAGLHSKRKKEYPTPHIIVWKNHPQEHVDTPIVYPLRPSPPNMLEDYKLLQSHMIECMQNTSKKVKLPPKNIETKQAILDSKFRYLRDGISFVNHLSMLHVHASHNENSSYSTKMMIYSLRQKRYNHLEYILNKQLEEIDEKNTIQKEIKQE